MRKDFSLFLIVLLTASIFSVLFVPEVSALDPLITEYVDQYTSVQLMARVHPTYENYYSAWGESFTMGAENYFLTQVSMPFRRYGSATGHIQMQLYASTGTSGVNATATGSALAVSDTLSSSLFDGSSAYWFSFNFTGANSYELQASTTYVIVAVTYNQTIGSTQYVRCVGDDSSPTYAGNSVFWRNGTWQYSSSVDADFRVYGIQEKLTASNLGNSNTENGISSVFSSYWVATGAITASGYILSINYGSGYSNSSWQTFSSGNNVWGNLSQTLLGSSSQIGNTVNYKFYANASNQKWYESSVSSFTLQATVTFLYWDVGRVDRENSLLTANSSTTYTAPITLHMDALPNSTYSFLSWNWTNSESSSLDNPLSFIVTNKTTLTCQFYYGYSFGYSVGWISGYASGYSAGYTVGYADGLAAGGGGPGSGPNLPFEGAAVMAAVLVFFMLFVGLVVLIKRR